jgi:hypothetical protein
MNAYVFTGPTLPANEAREELDAIYLPPASQGDVYRAASRKPRAIGIIDGYFECIPAVWHKEILWAMAQGVHVFGCSSIGALRAAELAAFGMEGIGKIFEAYRDGTLEDDDEVAVTHMSADRDYQPTSVAMVNIRATFEAATKAGIIEAVTRRKLEQIAKELFYQARSYRVVLDRAGERGLSDQLDALRRWLPTGQVDQKRQDALAMLQAMQALLKSNPPPKHVQYSFEYTANWELARSRAGSLQIDSRGRGDTLFMDRVLDELRLEGDTFARARQAVLLRFLALEEARRQGITPTPGMLRTATRSFRRELGVEDQVTFQGWLMENQLSHDEFLELMKEEASLEWVRNQAEIDTTALTLDYLRMTGRYARLASRAREKQHILELEGLQYPSSLDAGLTEDELLRWYFEERLGRPVPADLARYCRLAGFGDEGSFQRAILREYCYTDYRKII